MSLDGIRSCFTSMEKGFEKGVTVFCAAANESKPTEFALKLTCILRMLPPLAHQTFSRYAGFLETASISADVKSLLDHPSIAGGLFVFADKCSLLQKASSVGLISLSSIASKVGHFTVWGHTPFKGASASMLGTACGTSLAAANCLAAGSLLPKLKKHYNKIQVEVGLSDKTYTEAFKARWNDKLKMRNALYDFVFHTSSAIFFSANVFYPTAFTSGTLTLLSALSVGAGFLKNYNPPKPRDEPKKPPAATPATPTPQPPPETPTPPQAPVRKPILPLRLAYGAVDVATVVQKSISGIDAFRHLLRSATLIAKENNLVDAALADDVIKICDEARDFNSKVLFAPWSVLTALKTPKNYEEFQTFVKKNKCVNEFFGALRVVSNLTGGINKFIGFFDYFARLGCRVPFITRLASGAGSSTVFGYGVGKSLSYITPSLRIVTTLSEGWRDRNEEFGLVKCFYTCSIEVIKLFYVHTGGKKFPKGSASGGLVPYAALALSMIHISKPIFDHYVIAKKEINYPGWMQRSGA